MLKTIKQIAIRLGVYDRLRYSDVYRKWLSIKNPNHLAHQAADIEFYKTLFGGARLKLIFDIGANYGDKGEVFSRLSERVVCVEPDPSAAKSLRIRFRKPTRGSALVTVCESAVGATVGTLKLLQQSNGSAYNSLSTKHAELHQIQSSAGVEVKVATLDSLIAEFGVPDFLKVDVEGFELEVFSGLTRSIPLLCFEANLPEFQSETIAVMDRLLQIQPSYRFNAVPNDDSGKWVFDSWQDAEKVKDHVRSIVRGSADIYAIALPTNVAGL